MQLNSSDAPPIVDEHFSRVTSNAHDAPTWDHLAINHYITMSRWMSAVSSYTNGDGLHGTCCELVVCRCELIVCLKERLISGNYLMAMVWWHRRTYSLHVLVGAAATWQEPRGANVSPACREQFAEKQLRKSGAGRSRSWDSFDLVDGWAVHNCTDAAERYGAYP